MADSSPSPDDICRIRRQPSTMAQDAVNHLYRKYFIDPVVLGKQFQALADVADCLAATCEAPDAISGRRGHDATIRAACECYRWGLSDDQTWTNGRLTREVVYKPPWTDQELKHKIGDAKKKVEAEGQTGIPARGRMGRADTIRRDHASRFSSCGRRGPSWVITLRLSRSSSRRGCPPCWAWPLAVLRWPVASTFMLASINYQPLNTYATVIADPGERKSQCSAR